MQNALRLDQMRVSEVMTPRTVVFSLPKETSLAEAVKEVARWPHSRAPVTEGGDLDEICGLVLQRDLYNAVANGRVEGTLESLMRPVVMVPEGMRVGDLLAKALRERKHLFVVGDEYGGTAGVVSLEDAIESLLGSEIVDEYDRDADMQKVARELADQKLQAASDDGDSYKPEPGKPESGKPESDRPESDTSGSG
jgi:CBS domain containing-hemolysin-like protein